MKNRFLKKWSLFCNRLNKSQIWDNKMCLLFRDNYENANRISIDIFTFDNWRTMNETLRTKIETFQWEMSIFDWILFLCEICLNQMFDLYSRKKREELFLLTIQKISKNTNSGRTNILLVVIFLVWKKYSIYYKLLISLNFLRY